MWFGRDISKIPCFRNSFLYGIGGGLSTGLATFMFTSRPQLASHCAIGAFTLVTLTYWMQCRYKYSDTKFKLAQIKAGMQQHVMYEGTHVEKEIKNNENKD